MNESLFNPLNHPGAYGIGGGQVVAPPSFQPAINSLSDMMEGFAEKRRQLAQFEESQRVQALREHKEASDEEFTRARQRSIDAKTASGERFQRAKFGQDSIAAARKEIAAGRHPGTMLLQDETGNPSYVDWNYVPGANGAQAPGEQPSPEQAAPAAPQPDVPRGTSTPEVSAPVARAGQQALAMPQLRAPGLAGGPLPPTTLPQPMPTPPGQPAEQSGPSDQDLEALMAASHQPAPPQPQQPQPSPLRRTIFMDENDQGDVRALAQGPEGADSTTRQLPIDAFPPGAREGQRFNEDDVNLRGGKGNPYAEPAPPITLPGQKPQESSSMSLGQHTEGYSGQMPQGEGQGGVWQAKLPDGRVITIDPRQARQARQDENLDTVRQIDAAMQDPNISGDEKLALRRNRALVISGMPPQIAMQINREAAAHNAALDAQAGKKDLQEGQIAGQQDLERLKQEGAKSLQQLRQEGQMALQASKHKGHGGSGLGGVKLQGGEGGDVEYIPIPQTRFGPRPDMLLSRVEQAWRSNSLDEKLPVQLAGLRRLNLAEHNLSASGPNAGVLNIEAAFNYLGFVRGGVPVQNETREMLDQRRTWADRIHGTLARAGLGEMAARFSKGEELTKDEVNQALNVMSPAEKARIAEGIRESKAVMTGQVADTITPFATQFASMGGPGGHLIRQYAVDITNQRLRAAGLPADYNPFHDTRVAGASPFMRKPGQGGQPGSQDEAPQDGGSAALDSAFQQLMKMKAAKK